MFISDKVIFLQLDKTASTHIAQLLHGASPGEFHAKHSRLTRGPGGRCVIGSVRNPWDWYVSLWAYGCLGRGKVRRQHVQSFPRMAFRLLKQNALHPARWATALRKIAAHARKDTAGWRRLYASADDPRLFRAWLRAMLSEPGKDLLSGIWEYPDRPFRAGTGLLTYRFLRLFVESGVWRREAGNLRSLEDIRALYAAHRNARHFVRMEHLGPDLTAILSGLGIPFDPARFRADERTNPSQRHGPGYYYDAETIELVRRQEQFLIAEFGYLPPELPVPR